MNVRVTLECPFCGVTNSGYSNVTVFIPGFNGSSWSSYAPTNDDVSFREAVLCDRCRSTFLELRQREDIVRSLGKV